MSRLRPSRSTWRSPLATPGALALVTGAGSGIGRATAEALATAGARVLCVDLDGDAAAVTAKEVSGQSYAVDVADRAAMLDLADRVHAEHGPLDLLVNNAGVGMSAHFLDTSLDDWDWIVGINLLGVVHGCHAFGRAMVDARRGHVVNVASGMAWTPRATESAYVSTKAGVVALSHCLRGDWLRAGVGVSVICPGPIATNIISGGTRFRGERDNPTLRRRMTDGFAKGHPPSLVADAIVDAVRRNRPFVPVSPEAKFGWAVFGRLLPVRALGRTASWSPGGI